MAFMQIAATALSAISSISGGNQQAANLNAQATQSEQNAALARQQGGAREYQVRRTNAKRLAEQRAAVAQSGFAPSGMLDLQGEAAGNAELDALTTRYESELQAIGYQNQAASQRANAKTAKKQGNLNAFGSIMQGASNYFGGTRLQPPAPVSDRKPDWTAQ